MKIWVLLSEILLIASREWQIKIVSDTEFVKCTLNKKIMSVTLQDVCIQMLER